MLKALALLALLATAQLPAIHGIYPDPATDEDRGEFVILSVPEVSSVTNFTLTDGEDEIELDELTPGQTVAVTDDAGPVRNLTDYPVRPVDEFLSLANGGEWVALKGGNRTLDNVTYPRATEGERYREGLFTPLGRTDFEPLTRRNVTVRPVILPDESAPLLETIESGRDRILLAGYTFTDSAVTDALIAAHGRNVTVRVLLEGGPVGGISRPQVAQLDRLEAAGIPVHTMGTAHARYRYHHAKYAVVDSRALVTSENWKPGGTGGHGSRGWGVIVRDRAVADYLARIFAEDTGYVDTLPWESTRPESAVAETPDTATYPTRFATTRSRADAVTVLAAPETAGQGVRRALEAATTSIRVQQVSIDERGTLLNATLAAADRGVDVRILLSRAWYVERENRALATRLRERADRENLPLEVSLAEPRSRYEKIHVKGVIVDEESVFVGSLNWNENAREENREVILRIDDPETAAYFSRVFLADWRGAAWRVPWGVLGGVVVAILSSLPAIVKIGTFEAD
ncbi:MAG: phosphatidylserine/phosphatidylglycerophosphate/cardiolipin synthase family protein [Halodesulfurarchaeum sp.]